VAIVEDARIEASLPEMAVAPLFVVEILRIAHMESVQGFAERIGGPRDADVMDVVCHQAVGPDVEGVAPRVKPEPVEIAAVVGVLFEDDLLVIAALGDLVRVT
jgi:hypothetical protein